MSERGKGEEI
jgi:hypothetical protein